MTRPTAWDEHFVHQIPELLPNVATRDEHWRESYFFDLHDPSGEGDVIFFTFAHYPARGHMDSLQMGRIGGEPVIGFLDRPDGDDPLTTSLPGASVEIVRPWHEVRLLADPAVSNIGLDLTFTARTQPYGLRRGTMRAGHDVVWDQCHTLQSGTYHGTYTAGGVTHPVDGWIGQRDHSWGIRDHGRCPLWMWFQIQLDDGFLGVWHWELANGARIYTDGCWAGTDGRDPVPVVDFHTDVAWTAADGSPGRYGEHGDDIAGLSGTSTFVLDDGRRLTVEAEGAFAATLRAVPARRAQPHACAHRRRSDRHRDLRGHRCAPPSILPRHDRERETAIVSAIATHPDELTAEWLTDVLRASDVLAGASVTAVETEPLGTGQMCDSVRVRTHVRRADGCARRARGQAPGRRRDEPGHRRRHAQLREGGPVLRAARDRSPDPDAAGVPRRARRR